MRKLKKRKYQYGNRISSYIYMPGIGDKWELNVQNSKSTMQQQRYRHALDMYDFQSKLTGKANLYTSIGDFLENTTNNIMKSVNESSLEDDDETTEKENQNDGIYGNGLNINVFYNSILGNGAYGTYTSQNKKSGKIKKIRKGQNSLDTSYLFNYNSLAQPSYVDYLLETGQNSSEILNNYVGLLGMDMNGLYDLTQMNLQQIQNSADETAQKQKQINALQSNVSKLQEKKNGSPVSNLFGANDLKLAKAAKKLADLDEGDAAEAGKALKGARMNTAGMTMGAAADIGMGVMDALKPEKYVGASDTLTKMRQGYDAASNIVMKINPLVGGLMKGVEGILLLTNQLTGKKTDSFTVDESAYENLGGSYSGSYAKAQDAAEKAGTTYGGFAKKQYKKAQKEIAEAKRQQSIVQDISDTATERFDISDSMAAINNNRRELQMEGGYHQNAVSVGEEGEKLGKSLKRVKRIKKKRKKKFQMGGVIEPQYKLYPKTEKIQFSVENLGGEPVYIARPAIQRPVIQQPERSEIEKIDPRTYFPSITDDIIIPSDEEIQRKMSNDYSNIIVPSDEELAEIIENLNAKGEPRSMEELIQYAEEKNPRFILRMKEFPMILGFENDYAPTVWTGLGLREYGSHLLSWDDDGNGNAYVYPCIMEEHEGEGDLKKYSPDKAWKIAEERGDYLVMSPEEAEIFTDDTYKEFYPDYMSKFGEMSEFAREHPDMSGPAIRQLFMEKDEITSIPEYQEGGSIIPDGALHAHKHHIETEENITQKGIPVVIENKDGEIEQVAEIERGEIIFSKEFTEKLENLCKLYYNKEIEQEEKENIALEAGLLLVNEILNNTEDKTGELL